MNRMNEVMDAVSKVDSVKLRELAGHYSDKATYDPEDGIVEMAIITYCLHKIFIKMHMKDKTQPLVEAVLKDLSTSDLKKVLADIDEFDYKNGLFEGGLAGKARIKIGSRLHSRGISLTQSASLTGAAVSDILDYVGETRGYQHKEGKTVAERLNTARDLFR